ncbi:MAG: hypothetical protein IJ418_02620 [Clostridia bacterium]|nr:hypothetical protein [Clostridia bacterium]
MAQMETNGLDEYLFSFKELEELPDAVLKDMLQAEGEVIKRGQSETASSMLQGPYYRGGVASGIKLGKFKRNRANATMYVTFEGTQHGNRIAEIAFINEFGKHGQPPRQFIREANERFAEEAVDAAAKIYDQYLTSKGL